MWSNAICSLMITLKICHFFGLTYLGSSINEGNTKVCDNILWLNKIMMNFWTLRVSLLGMEAGQQSLIRTGMETAGRRTWATAVFEYWRRVNRENGKIWVVITITMSTRFARRFNLIDFFIYNYSFNCVSFHYFF